MKTFTPIFLFIFGILFGFILCKRHYKKNVSRPAPQHKPRQGVVHKMVMMNVPTQKIDDYKNIGHINSGNTLLPLYGRQLHRGSQLWQYYTISDGNIPIHLSFEHQGRDCGSEYGCKELYDGDSVVVDEYGKTFDVNINKEYMRYVMYA